MASPRCSTTHSCWRSGATPKASWYVLFKPGYEMGIKPDAPMPSPGHYLGMHGYDPALPEMRSTFLVSGPGVPAGRDLGSIDMRDIAPTLAALMGARLPTAQGRVLLHPTPLMVAFARDVIVIPRMDVHTSIAMLL